MLDPHLQYNCNKISQKEKFYLKNIMQFRNLHGIDILTQISNGQTTFSIMRTGRNNKKIPMLGNFFFFFWLEY